ncbi:MAG: hypothetical protein JO279_07760 [Verrucomicrobia bacterium]|nr:hypothetical protein [Verrucomicrobiota bacterium]
MSIGLPHFLRISLAVKRSAFGSLVVQGAVRTREGTTRLACTAMQACPALHHPTGERRTPNAEPKANGAGLTARVIASTKEP